MKQISLIQFANLFFSFERTNNNQISNITFQCNRFSTLRKVSKSHKVDLKNDIKLLDDREREIQMRRIPVTAQHQKNGHYRKLDFTETN